MAVDVIVVERVYIVDCVARLEAQTLARLYACPFEVPIARDKQARVGLQVIIVIRHCLELLQVHGSDFALSELFCLFLGADQR